MQPVHTEITVDITSGVKIQSTNDSKVIKTTESIQKVYQEIVQQNIVSAEYQIASVVTKTSESKVQTNLVTVAPSHPEENIIVVAIFDLSTG